VSANARRGGASAAKPTAKGAPPRARRAKAAAPASLAAAMDTQAEAAADFLKAMANPQRLRVLCVLLEGERSVGEINAQVALSQSALSQHLAVLRDSQLVATRREAQTVYYSVPAGPAHDVLEVLHAAFCAQPDAQPLCG
jgi:DNA-binding transcriptional ArsR family regulator